MEMAARAAMMAKKSAGTPPRIVVGAIDDNMVYPLLVWAWSLHHTAQAGFRFVIGHLAGTLSDHNRSTLGQLLDFMGIEHEFRALPFDNRFITQGHISPTTFAKFVLADMISTEHVWIDVDTVASTGWDSIFSAIEKPAPGIELIVAERGVVSAASSRMAASPSDLAFNAGVLGWPAGPRRAWSETLDSMAQVQTQEQHLFNDLYAGAVSKVPESFNTLTYRIDTLKELPQLPHILHFAGAHKPWQLPKRFRKRCHSHECPWSLWFSAERDMQASLPPLLRASLLHPLQRAALRSGQGGWAPEQRGLGLLNVLQKMGPFGWLLVIAAKPFRALIPRGTHPLHYS